MNYIFQLYTRKYGCIKYDYPSVITAENEQLIIK